MIGKVLHGYNVVDRIKDGSVGSIWLAGKGGKMYALKMIFERHLRSREKRRRFRREARIARGLEHPCVIRTFDYYEGPPRPFYAMEYFPSENLKHYILYEPEFLEGRRLTIFRQICEALRYIHRKGIVHRDLKPENVLVGRNGSIRLIDFSIAQTKFGRVLEVFGRNACGTPTYMSPEQISRGVVGPRSDYYSLGVVAFELFTGKPPFAAPSMQALFEKHLKEPVPSARSLSKSVPNDIDRIVQALMQKNPNQRPATLEDIIYLIGKHEVRA